MERSLGYRPGLDGVRALAIGLVLLNHTGLSIFLGGGNGVIVFFVLSGFLITKLMIEESDRTGGISIGGFYGRRAVRILPAPTVMLLVLLAASWAITDSTAEHRFLLQEIGLSITYLMNMRPLILGPTVIDGVVNDGFLGHMWSLAVEEQFYLVWPLAMTTLALARRSSAKVTRVLLAIAGAVAVVRLFVYYVPALDPDWASIAVFSFDAFALGAAMAFAFHRGVFPRFERFLARPVVPVAAIAVLLIDLVAGKYSHEISSLYVVYCSLASAALIGHIFVAPGSPISTVSSYQPVVMIGKLSYSIYLWHNPIWVFVSRDRFPGAPLAMLTVLEWTLTVLAVLGSYYLIEKPAMRLRKRFAHDQVPPAAAAPASSFSG